MNKKSVNITIVIKSFIIFVCEFIIDTPRPVLRALADQTVKKARNRKAYKK